MNCLSRILLMYILCSVLQSQVSWDARMLGLNGSYTTIANGYQSVGINPANLAIHKSYSINLFNTYFDLSNNFMSISNYNAINGANLEEPESTNYYPKKIFMIRLVA